MAKFVQGVQGAVQGFVQAKTQAARGLCRGCRGFPYVTRARKAQATFKKYQRSRVYGMPAHPAHPAQTTAVNASQIFAPCTAPCTPCTTIIFLKKMKKIVCGQENVTEFNRQLKAMAPEFHNLAKQLHTAGLITGLRGATLEIGEFSEHAEPAASEPAARKHCEECGLWVRDTIGSGAGIGECLINSRPAILKWPKQTACNEFKVIA